MAVPVEPAVRVFPALADEIARDEPYLLDLYTHLHRNPELSFHERATAARMAVELRTAGFAVTENVGGMGVVAVVENGAGPKAMLRADMDALPVTERTGLPYASQVQTVDAEGHTVGVMHACGHDVHMTSLVGAARRLAALRAEWKGTLILIAQPAEERGGGAKAMIEDGLFTRFPRPDFNVSLHVNAELPCGVIGYTPGYTFANVDSVDIAVHGVGGHGAYPHGTKDPVVLAAQIVTALQTLVSREVDPQDPAVVTVGSIQGGAKHNVIPDRVDLQLTVRSYDDAVRRQLLDGVKRIATHLGRAAGLPDDRLPEVVVRDEHTPAAFNNSDLSRRIAKVFTARFGADSVKKIRPVMGGEDFSRYGRVEPKIPSFIFWLGAVDPARFAEAARTGEKLPTLHSPFFAPAPRPTLTMGVEAMTAAALDLLR